MQTQSASHDNKIIGFKCTQRTLKILHTLRHTYILIYIPTYRHINMHSYISEAGHVMESHEFAKAKKYLKRNNKDSLWTPMPESPTQGSASGHKSHRKFNNFIYDEVS